MKPAPFDYLSPASLAEAVRLLAGNADRDVRLIAGGQSLGPMLNLRVAMPDLLVDISRLEELTRHAVTQDHVEIGAGVAHARIEDGEIAGPTGAMLARVAGAIAYRAVRNRGTIGGSLAHADPSGDWLPVMLGLDATVRVTGPAGLRVMPVRDLVDMPLSNTLAPDEILTTIRVPALRVGVRLGHEKVTAKTGAFAMSIGFVRLDPDGSGARAILSSSRDIPASLPRLEAALGARGGDDALMRALAEDLRQRGDQEGWDPAQLRLHETVMKRAIGRALQ